MGLAVARELLLRRYGKPEQQRHGIQVEINRKLYMDEATLQTNANLATLRGHLRQMVEQLLAVDPRRLR